MAAVLAWAGARMPLVLGALGIALVLALAFGAVETSRAKAATAERDAARNDVRQMREADVSKEATISALQAAVKQWRATCTPADSATAAANRAAQAEHELATARAALRQREAADNAKPECAKLLAADLGAVCPAVADGVRERAGGRVPRPPD